MAHHPWHDVALPRYDEAPIPAINEIPTGSKVKYELDKSSGLLVVDRLDAEGGVIEQEGLLFTGHIDEGNRIAMTLIPFPVEPAPLEPAAATMHGTWAGNTIKATWENLTFGNTGWATLNKQAP